MPRPYNNAVITDAGIELLDKAQAGQASIQFTRMATGNGTYTADEKTPSALKMCTTLKSEKNSYPLSSVGVVPGGGVKLTALITNQDPATGATLVNEGYHINEIGLYAREKGGSDDTEVLYSITVAAYDTGDYMPAYTDGAPRPDRPGVPCQGRSYRGGVHQQCGSGHAGGGYRGVGRSTQRGDVQDRRRIGTDRREESIGRGHGFLYRSHEPGGPICMDA